MAWRYQWNSSKRPDHNKCISPIHKRTTIVFILLNSNILSWDVSERRARCKKFSATGTAWANPFKHCCGLHVNSTSSLWHDVLATEDLMNPHISLCQVFLLSLAPRSTSSVFIMKMTRRPWKYNGRFLCLPFNCTIVCVFRWMTCACFCACVRASPSHPCSCNPWTERDKCRSNVCEYVTCC